MRKNEKGWIGVILNGDETEAYTLAHIDGIRAAAENVSLPEQDIIWKERVGANDGCKSAVKDLIRQGCEIIIANSAIYEEAIKSEAERIRKLICSYQRFKDTEYGNGRRNRTHKSLQCTYGYLRSFLCGRSHGRNESSKAEGKKRFPQRV